MSKLNPTHYNEHSTFQKTVAQAIMQAFPPKREDIILDIGCGDGFLSAKLAEIATDGRVLGIDPSQEMIDFAAQKYPLSVHPNLRFRTGLAESDHGASTYALITAFNCLHWSRSPVEAFNNCYQALKQQGRFFGVTYPQESVYWRMFIEVFSKQKWKPYLASSPVDCWLSSEGYRQLAADCHFKILQFSVEDCAITYSCREELGAYIKGWLSCMLPVAENLQLAFLNDVLDQAEQQFSNQSFIEIPYTKLTYCFER
jgi:SAM-dependent methyltransferase